MTFLCVIPARKNSKRIKNKNLLKINGKTLISITIKEAQKSKYIDNQNIFVSTDSEKIKKEAELCGAKVPFLRPMYLGKDMTKMHDVLNHFFQKIKKTLIFKYIIVLQPTSPLRTFKHINEACKFFLKNKKKANKLVSVTHLPQDFYPSKIMKSNKSILSQLKGYENYHAKKINLFARNGPAVFIYSKRKLKNNIYQGKSLKYLMSEKSSLDLNFYSDIKKINN